MADGIKATVEGTVARAFKRGTVIEYIVESRDKKFRRPEYVTIWDLFGVGQGDRVRVTGDLSAQLRYYEGRAQVQVAINNITDQEVLERALQADPSTGELADSAAGWGA